MNKIIGRGREQKELINLYESGKPEFVAIYGRRRVGKTFLIKELFSDKLTFYHSGLSPYDRTRRITMRDQLEAFYSSLISYGMEEEHCPQSWMEALSMLAKLLETKDNGSRQLIFIDELPWLDTNRSKFLIAFEHFWNTWCAWHDRVMLVVCGSASLWILDNLINNHGGLYDRLTWQIKLSPFTLAECKEFFNSKDFNMSNYDLIETYMAVGGIPYYLNYFQRGLSIAQNIDLLFFDKNAKLKKEFDRLFGSLFSAPETYKTIVEFLSTKHSGYTRDELGAKFDMKSGGSLTKILEALTESDFIEAYKPFANGNKGMKYKVIDNFCLFALRFLISKRIKDASYWLHNHNTPSVNAWRGIAFEQVCFNHIAQIKRALGIGNVTSEESSWIMHGNDTHAGAQIDMIITRDDRVVNLCEMKFVSTDFEVTSKYCQLLRERVSMLQEKLSFKQSIHLTLVTTNGIKQNAYSGIFQNIITINDLIL